MKKICLFLTFLSFLISNAQTSSTVDWINANAIAIEDANPNNPLIGFAEKAPQKFIDAQIFGFGEASHHGKEFFDIKAKFFKYLVEEQGVKIFIMEECYQAEKGVNEWISGGKGDRLTVADNFSIMPWYCNEVVDLLEWMRNYNQGKAKDEQIRFYGMDIQNGKKINLEIREFVKKYNTPIDENLLAVMDSCAERPYRHPDNIKWANNQLPNLAKIEEILLKNESNDAEYIHVLRAFRYLKSYITFLQNPKFHVRDQHMFKNVLEILANNTSESKAFVWAHNEHINKNGRYNVESVGKNLKDHFGEKYYSVGFDFATGILPGIIIKKGKILRWEHYTLNEPYKKTFAETLVKVNPEIFFIDMQLAINHEPTGFFSMEKKHLGLGAPGFNPKKPVLMRRNFTDTYDGLIFVKKINKPTKITQ